MTPERVVASSCDLNDAALHDEIKLRAYELYARPCNDMNHQDTKNELRFELRRVAYAASHIQMSNDGFGDDRIVRAARVYLRALSSYIAQW